MKLMPPLVESTETSKTSFVDPKSLSKEQKALVDQVEQGHVAEAKLIEEMHGALGKQDEFTSTELDINSEKGSYLRIATIDGATVEDDKEVGQVIVSEMVNGHMTELMASLNKSIEEKVAEEDAKAAEAEEA